MNATATVIDPCINTWKKDTYSINNCAPGLKGLLGAISNWIVCHILPYFDFVAAGVSVLHKHVSSFNGRDTWCLVCLSISLSVYMHV